MVDKAILSTAAKADMTPLIRSLAAAATASSLAAGANAADIRVPDDQPTIQQGIRAAVDGDRVLVYPGTYDERIDFEGRNIQVIGVFGPEQTMIDAQLQGRVATFQSGETRAAVLTGFTLRHGFVRDNGGGVLVAGSSPEIRANVIGENRACNGGGIAVIDGGQPRISDNRIVHNRAGKAHCGEMGGGVFLDTATFVVVEGNHLEHNVATYGGGIAATGPFGANPLLSRNVIQSNVATQAGGGVWMEVSHGRLDDSLIVRNRAQIGAAVFVSAPDPAYHPWLINDTIADNAGGDDDVFVQVGTRGNVALINTIVQTTSSPHSVQCAVARRAQATFYDVLLYSPNGATTVGDCTWEGTVLAVDPQFRDDRRAHHYRLRPTSPAIDAGRDDALAHMRTDLLGAPA